MSIYCKEFLAIYHAFLEYSHILWETTLPTLVMTDNRSVTRFFQTKAIPPTLWNACDYVLQFNFHIMHVAGTQNTAADFLSRIELTPKERVELKIREDIRSDQYKSTYNLLTSQMKNNFSSFQMKQLKPKKKSSYKKNKMLDKMRAMKRRQK